MNDKIKLIFFGTPEIAVEALRRLHEEDSFEVLGVVTQQDKPVGRKRILTPPPIKKYAESHSIPVYQPEKLNAEDVLYDQLAQLQPDYNVVFAYGQMMSQSWLDLPTRRSVNVHASLLPKYRGASPMQEALLHGDTETGVTIQDMSLKMDTGDILAVESFDIGLEDTIFEVHDIVSDLGAKLLSHTLRQDMKGAVCPLAQDDAYASYCSKISKENGYVDLAVDTSEDIYNKYRAYKMWPGVWTYFDDNRLKLTELVFKNGKLKILKVHPAGKKEMSYEDFLRGRGNG